MSGGCSLILKAKGRPFGRQLDRRRVVALLRYPSHRHVNLPEAFDELDEKAQGYLQNSFDRWNSGYDKSNSRYHAYTREGYKKCIHFRQNDYRFYGVKVHHLHDTQCEVCVLGTRVEKHEWSTEYVHLDRLLRIVGEPVFVAALNKLCTELGP